MRSLFSLTVALALAAVVAGAGSALADRGGAETLAGRAEPQAVASLEPRETQALWRRLVSGRPRQLRAQADCRPLRAVFYAATDYLRLATKLAERMSPCAQYYVSIPPLVADKTKPRPNAAWRVRALGPNFHALAEVHFTTWTRWVASTNSSWHAAGVEFRRRMADAGYDVAAGDSWVLNELSTAVRRGSGNARANIREFLRGLYEGDGARPAKGAVFVVGVGQRTTDVSLYQTNLQNWFADTAFWSDMSAYVSDWGQEVYGDVRNWAAPGMPVEARRDSLNDYLQHKLVLAVAGPPTVEPARGYLREAFFPLANAAWERESGYGWTMVPAEQMGAWLSAQVHALRYFSATSAQPQDHWGFAWSPRNGTGMSAGDFASRTSLILERLSSAIRDSAQTTDPANPGSAACGPPGQNLWCVGDLPDGRLNEAWKSFRGWTQSALAFPAPTQTVQAGTPSGVLSLRLVTSSGLSVTTPVPLTVTLSSSSRTGTFATSVAGPWATTLSLPIQAGAGATPTFYYQDTRAGSHTLTASAAGATTGTQTVTVTPGPLVLLRVAPGSATVTARESRRFSASGTDAFGNTAPARAVWSLSPPAAGTLLPRSGETTTFVAGRTVGRAAIIAAVPGEAGLVTAEATVQIEPGLLRIGAIRFRARSGRLLVTASAVDRAGRPISNTTIAALVRRQGRPHYTTRALTGAAGKVTFTVPARRGGCFALVVRRASAPGFAWNGRTPRNRFCLPVRRST